MKKLLLALMTAVVLSALLSFATYADDVTVTLNGEKVDCASYGQEATIVEGRTLVPLRAIFEALGASVEWNAETRTVDSKLGETEISLTIGENKLIKNGEEIALDVPAQIMNGRTLVPVRAVSESFGVEVEWDGEKRIVSLSEIADETEPDNAEENEEETLPKTKAYGDFYFGMTKEDVLKELASTGASEFDNEISVSFPEECKEVDNRITGDAVIENMDFEFENGKLQKMVLFTDYGARGECLETLENMTEYYGEPTDKKKGDEEYIWVVDGGNVKVTATVYCLENSLLIDPNYGYYVEIQIKYTGNAFDEPEEKEDEAESEEKEYIYGEYYFGMSWDEVKKAIDKFELRSVGGTAIRTFIEKNDLDFRVDLDDENGKYNDEDETVTGKTNIKKMSFYVEDKSLKGIVAETDSMTYAEADFVVKVFNERYGNPDIAIKDPEVYEWICEDKIITLDVCDNYGDKEKPFYVKFDLKKEKYRKNRSFNILDKIPLGLNLENASSYFPDSNEKMSQNKLEFFDIKDEEYIDYYDGFLGEDGECVDYKIGKKSWDKYYKTNIDDFYYVDENGRRRYDIKPGDFPLVETYSERNDVMGSEFDCTYMGFDLVDGVCDNCLVKTVNMPHNEAGHALISVVKYFGIDSAVYDAENNVYEWEKYNFGGKNGVSKVNIFVGIAEAEHDRYYCYISIQIADNGRYSFVDEEGRIAGYDYPHAYGNFYFGMTVEQAEAVIKGEKEVNGYVLRINNFDDEDETITGNINFDSMEVLFDSTTKVLCGVRTSGENVSEEQAASVLEGLRAYYGETDEEKESSNGKAYSWVLRGKNALVNFEVVKAESSENVYVCSYSIILAGSRIAK